MTAPAWPGRDARPASPARVVTIGVGRDPNRPDQIADPLTDWLSALPPAVRGCRHAQIALAALGEVHQALAVAVRTAHTDPLTGLANRAGLTAAAEALPADEFGLLVLDLDRFKPVNDQFGHAAGDEVLKLVARRLAEVAGPAGGTAARLGGDEFAVLLPAPVAPEAVAATVRAALRRPYPVAGRMLRLGASVGAVRCHDEQTLTGALAAADREMYRAKVANTVPLATVTRISPISRGPGRLARPGRWLRATLRQPLRLAMRQLNVTGLNLTGVAPGPGAGWAHGRLSPPDDRRTGPRATDSQPSWSGTTSRRRRTPERSAGQWRRAS
ncbi:MAG TPA: GGDEF domain-containing protein [Mycobacteriales bacterium]|nr:GGDEF domain-containing protein [Mycobacteriales bacterium]